MKVIKLLYNQIFCQITLYISKINIYKSVQYVEAILLAKK